MAKLSTQLALRKLLNDEQYELNWIKAGYSKAERARIKYRFDRDQLSLDKMREILEKCGFTIAVVEQWNTPK